VAPLAVPLEASCSVEAAGEILPVDVAAAKAIAAARPVVEVERVALLEARGRIAARPVGSPMRLPPFDNSAMDGYAVRRADLSGDGPWRLPVQGLVKAGDAASAPEGKCAVRIFTGAPVPEGFDAVVMQERCEVRGGGVVIGCMPRPGENVKRAGEDVGSGSRLVDSGDVKTLAWLKSGRSPKHTEFRDDRVVAAFNFFSDGNGGDGATGEAVSASVAYIVRAVTPGTFVHPAATVEDMYRPERFARTASGMLDIQAAK